MKNNRLAQLVCVVVLGVFLISCNTSGTVEEDSLTQSVDPGPDDVSMAEEENSLMQPAQPDNPSTADDITASQNQEENIRAYIETEDGYGYVEYASREAFLQACNFHAATPFHEYYDMDGNLAMELFYDEAGKAGCGIRYYYSKPDSLFAGLGMHGFVFEGVTSAQWEEPDKFSTASIHGSTGADDPFIEDYEETLRMNENGKPEYFFSQGDVTYLGGEQPQPLIEISFTYREDGTLQHKKYHHNMLVFETPSTTRDCFYDEEERLIFEDIYHTHGSNEYYYLYSDGGAKPTYALWLDNIAGTWVPELIQYDSQS